MKGMIGGKRYEAKKEGSVVVITFYPKITAEYPDIPMLKIKATKDDLKKLVKLAS